MVQKDLCPTLISYIQATCQCYPIPLEQNKSGSQPASLFPRYNRIYEISGNGTSPVQGSGPYSPIWQVFPTDDLPVFAMYDLYSEPRAREAIDAMMQTKKAVITKSYNISTPNLWTILWGSQCDTGGNLLLSPVIASDKAGSTRVVGSVVFDLDWAFILATSVPLGGQGIHIVLENSCGQQKTFKSNGNLIEYAGEGDLHDPDYSATVQQSTYEDYRLIQSATAPYATGETSPLDCAYRVKVYSSQEFRSSYVSHKPRFYALAILMIFAFICLLFTAYDCYVSRRHRKVMNAALQRDEIVSSLFPTEIHERLFSPVPAQTCPIIEWQKLFRSSHPKAQLPDADMIDVGDIASVKPRTEAIADYFPLVTVVFADISGFTAWSSEREPSQVFDLLETVYQAFDKLVNRIGIFKVETTGDCYVAAAGIPGYQPDHAVRAVKFAYECVVHMHELTRRLESSLGPSTLSLSIRVGVHSGPVIGGVLRGDKSRFQLFGDTMNTASRMQTTGEINTIQISSATASFLKEANKSNWVQPRSEPVDLKGKGQVQTFWADPLMSDEGTLAEIRESGARDVSGPSWGEMRLSTLLTGNISETGNVKRLVDWNTDLLLRLLMKVVASRCHASSRHFNRKVTKNSPMTITSIIMPLEEVSDILSVEAFHEKVAEEEPEPTDISQHVQSQLLDYVSEIALLYRDNPFHNFEHASHVAMAAAKVVMRIVKSDVFRNQLVREKRKRRIALKRKNHRSTFGISSDVLLQFAVVFSAVVHDVDHTGVSNSRLVKEGDELASRYNNKSVAEQNSVNIAWRLLTKDKYKDLFQCLCPNEHDQQRFRQLLVNAVIATDIADKELQQARKTRWDIAFPDSSETEDVNYCKEDMDRKATIVFEYIIQASDVAHTMQHWQVYKQWNERLFEEQYLAYLQGREDEDPSIGWYRGEIWFFDHYIIPLAKKLETCGVFGVSSDEYLSYALENRHEWDRKGEDIVRIMIAKYGPILEKGV